MRIFDLETFSDISDKELGIMGGNTDGDLLGPPGLAKKVGSGFGVSKPGLEKNITSLNGFAGPKAGNGANSGGEGNNGWQSFTNPG